MSGIYAKLDIIEERRTHGASYRASLALRSYRVLLYYEGDRHGQSKDMKVAQPLVPRGSEIGTMTTGDSYKHPLLHSLSVRLHFFTSHLSLPRTVQNRALLGRLTRSVKNCIFVNSPSVHTCCTMSTRPPISLPRCTSLTPPRRVQSQRNSRAPYVSTPVTLRFVIHNMKQTHFIPFRDLHAHCTTK